MPAATLLLALVRWLWGRLSEALRSELLSEALRSLRRPPRRSLLPPRRLPRSAARSALAFSSASFFSLSTVSCAAIWSSSERKREPESEARDGAALGPRGQPPPSRGQGTLLLGLLLGLGLGAGGLLGSLGGARTERRSSSTAFSAAMRSRSASAALLLPPRRRLPAPRPAWRPRSCRRGPRYRGELLADHSDVGVRQAHEADLAGIFISARCPSSSLRSCRILWPIVYTRYFCHMTSPILSGTLGA